MRFLIFLIIAVVVEHARGTISASTKECVRKELESGIEFTKLDFTSMNDATLRDYGLTSRLEDFIEVRNDIVDDISLASRKMEKATNEEELAAYRLLVERSLEALQEEWTIRLDESLENFTQDPEARMLKATKLAGAFLRLAKRVLVALEMNVKECFWNIDK